MLPNVSVVCSDEYLNLRSKTTGHNIKKWQMFQGRVVQNWLKITQGECKIGIQKWKLKKQIQFNYFGLQFDDWML